MQRRTLPCLLVVSLAWLSLAACSDDDDGSRGDEAEEPAPSWTAADASAGGGEAIAVTAIDYGYESLPSQVPAGTTVLLANGSSGEVHELAAFLLPVTETRSAVELFQLPQAQLDAALAGPPRVLTLALPGGEGLSPPSFGATFEEPGRYAYACFIGVGADPALFDEAFLEDAPERPDDPAAGAPHFTQGMLGELVVS